MAMTLNNPLPLDPLAGPAGLAPFDPEVIARIANDLFRGA